MNTPMIILENPNHLNPKYFLKFTKWFPQTILSECIAFQTDLKIQKHVLKNYVHFYLTKINFEVGNLFDSHL